MLLINMHCLSRSCLHWGAALLLIPTYASAPNQDNAVWLNGGMSVWTLDTSYVLRNIIHPEPTKLLLPPPLSLISSDWGVWQALPLKRGGDMSYFSEVICQHIYRWMMTSTVFTLHTVVTTTNPEWKRSNQLQPHTLAFPARSLVTHWARFFFISTKMKYSTALAAAPY